MEFEALLGFTGRQEKRKKECMCVMCVNFFSPLAAHFCLDSEFNNLSLIHHVINFSTLSFIEQDQVEKLPRIPSILCS